MTPQELKNSILQLAVQGKLVEQRPEEGSGEELYQQIQEEKQKLIANGKIKKEKPLPEIVEYEIPFNIPESWKWVRVRECISNRAGLAYDKTNLDIKSNNMVRVLRGGNIFDMGYTVNPEDIMISSEFVKPELFLQRNTIITPAVTSLEHVGKMGRIEKDYADMVVGGFVLMLVPHINNDTYSKFLMYAFSSKYFRDRCRNIVNKSGQAFYNISREKMMALIIPLPPLAEQKRIVAKIEELLPYIDRYEQAWSKLEDFNRRFPEDMQKSILQMAIQGKLVGQRPEEGTSEELYQHIQEEKQRLISDGKIKKEKSLPEITEDEIPFDIPENWKWVRVAQITILNPKNNLDDKLDAAFIPMPCVSDGFKNTHTFEVKKWGVIKKGFTHFADGDIGIAKITPCFQNRKSVVFRNLINGYGAGTTELSIVRVINDTVLREYLLWFFKTEYFIANGIKSFTGTAGQQRIHKDYLATCLIPLPPLPEQKRIVARLEEILPLCEKLK